jgi:glycosyltransferase involved in cell wall biosynthesis
MKKNKFSIITVVKNDVSNILITINSVRNQSYKNYEHIILDGNSSDGTSEVILRNKNSKIHYIRKKDKNLYDAINKGILKSSGDYILLIHSGDFFYENNTLNMINKFLQNKEDFIYGNLKFYKNFSIKRIWKIGKKKINKFNSFILPHPTLVVNKKIVKKIKYNTSYSIRSDADYIIKLLKIKNLKFNYINKYLIFMLSGGISSSYKNLLKKMIEDLKIYYKHFNLFGIILYFFKITSKLETFFFINKNKKNLKKLLKRYNKIVK